MRTYPREFVLRDPDCFLRTDQVTGDLKRAAVRGGTVTLIAQAGKLVLTTGATMILARLLTPADFGLVAMVAVIAGFVSMFKDMGLSMATIQREEISHPQVSTLFWVNVALSFAILIVLSALSPLVAWFYDEPRLVGITIALSGVFFLGGLTVQHQALLRRQMRFVALAAIEVTALLVGIVCAVGLALAGAGYWALVLQQVAVALATVAGVWVLCGWRPGRPRRGTGVRPMLAFGGNLTGFSVLNYVARNTDKLLIGWRYGPGATGLYAKAYQLLLLPIRQINAPISAVAIPTLSRLQAEPERYRSYYCNAMTLLAYITTPLIVVMFVLADEIITLLLGDQWIGAARIFRVLAAAAVGQPISNANGWIFISLGQTRRMLRWGMIAAPLFVIAFVIGLRWGAFGVATGYAACAVLLRFPGYLFAFRHSPLNLADLIGATWRPTTVSLLMLVVIGVTRHALADGGLATRLVIPASAGLVSLVLSVWVWPGARAEATHLFETAKLLRTPPARGEEEAAPPEGPVLD
jgi:PST family polysaccharide transporter